MDSRRFREIQEIGRGTFGVVLLCEDTATGEHVAIKRMKRAAHGHAQAHMMGAEIINHSALHHPHVVEFRGLVLAPGHVDIVMDYAAGGTLLDYVQRRRKLREPLARWFFQQLVVGLDYCHRKGVCNRDIKLDNLLLQPVPGVAQPLLLICDFGYAKSNEAWSYGGARVGTLNYVAPEVLHSECGYDSRKADVWSAGVVLYTMLTGSFPFAAPAEPPRSALAAGAARLLRHAAARRLAVPAELGLTPACVGLLRRLLEPEPERRVSVEEIMADPWFQIGLPANALAMNKQYLSMVPRREQPASEVRALVEQLQQSDSDDDSLDQLLLD